MVKRYRESCGEGGGVWEHPEGEYVLAAGYNALAAELEIQRQYKFGLNRDLSAAINRVAELEAELQALKAEHQWIPVDERLPKSDTEPVWCHGTYEGQYAPCGFEGIYRLSRWVCLNNSDYIDGGYGDDYEAIVTHWMPLPAAPQPTEGSADE